MIVSLRLGVIHEELITLINNAHLDFKKRNPRKKFNRSQFVITLIYEGLESKREIERLSFEKEALIKAQHEFEQQKIQLLEDKIAFYKEKAENGAPRTPEKSLAPSPVSLIDPSPQEVNPFEERIVRDDLDATLLHNLTFRP